MQPAATHANKPFQIAELLARMRTALRRHTQRKTGIPVLRIGDLEVLAVRDRVTAGVVEIKLTRKEYELLLFLEKHAGCVLSHRQILAAVWGPAHTEETQYLRAYIAQLRQKIEVQPSAPRIVLTEPGIGYRVAGLNDGPARKMQVVVTKHCHPSSQPDWAR